jgi:hypothetical protein
MSTHRAGTLARPPATLHGTPDNTGRRPGRLLAVVAVVLVATATGWLLAGRPGTGSHPGGPPATAANPAPSGSNDPAAPPDGAVTWQDFAGLDLPISPIAGPRCQAGGRASCFADTDDGAAIAAVHLLVRTFPFAGSAVFTTTIREQVVGPDAATLARLTSEAYAQLAPSAGVTTGAPIPSEGGWVAGFRLDPAPAANGTTGSAPFGDARTVRVLIRQADADGAAGFTEYAVRLVRRDGDWRLVAPGWGDWRTAARAMSAADPARYTTYDTLGSH